jgi:putative hydrolase of the HAD superfamily
LGIKTYFETIIVSEWEGVKKPDPLIFKKALEQLNVSPDESIYVGDHPENDVSAAQKAGMRGIWKKDSQWGSFETDFIIDDLAELPLIMERIWNECRKTF